jgi:hypothetical protein
MKKTLVQSTKKEITLDTCAQFLITSDALKIEPNSLLFYYCGWFIFNASDVKRGFR